MTCREFEHRATSLTLWELSQTQDQQILDHAGGCQKCAAWMQQQRMLAATMQTLQARTAACAAGPDVERALLRVFRQGTSQPVQPEMAHRFTPIAMRLSRFFEVGAYVAIAAAIVVALFLGVRLLEQRSINVPVKSQVEQPSVIADKSESQPHPQQPAVSRSKVNRPPTRRVQSASKSSPDTTEPSQANIDADYVALMFCDPLSCASDAQVVRMELPAQSNAQPQMADVVVGFDGVVRAVRIVN
ncbi:MAG: hypothetical protein WBQ76_06385 [Candidatus Korobacteraceae bacterium]